MTGYTHQMSSHPTSIGKYPGSSLASWQASLLRKALQHAEECLRASSNDEARGYHLYHRGACVDTAQRVWDYCCSSTTDIAQVDSVVCYRGSPGNDVPGLVLRFEDGSMFTVPTELNSPGGNIFTAATKNDRNRLTELLAPSSLYPRVPAQP